MSPQNSHVEILTFKVIRRWGLWQAIRLWGLHNQRIIKKKPQRDLPASATWGHSKKVLWTRNQDLTRHQICQHCFWTSYLPRLWEMSVICKLPSLWYFVIATWKDWDSKQIFLPKSVVGGCRNRTRIEQDWQCWREPDSEAEEGHRCANIWIMKNISICCAMLII